MRKRVLKVEMKSLYDVQQLLEKFGVIVHLGNRLWDIELLSVELQNLKDSNLIDPDEYRSARLILKQQHRIEEKHALDPKKLEEKFR